MRRIAVAGMALLVLAIPAKAGYQESVVQGNIDDDAEVEIVRTEPASANRTYVNVVDICRAGGYEESIHVDGPAHDLLLLKLYPIDTRPGKEILVQMGRRTQNPNSRGTHIIAWRHEEFELCGQPRRLFSFHEHAPRRPPPAEGANLVDYRVHVGQTNSTFEGKEIVLDELWARPGDSRERPSILRRVWYRYDQDADRHVVYDKRIIELRG